MLCQAPKIGKCVAKGVPMAQRNGQWPSLDCVRSTRLHKAVAKEEHDPAPALGLRGVVIISPLTAATGCLTSPAYLRTLPMTVRHLAPRHTTPCWCAPHISPSTLCATHRLAARATVPPVTAVAGHAQTTGELTHRALPGALVVGYSATHTESVVCCSGSLSLCDSNPRTPPAYRPRAF